MVIFSCCYHPLRNGEEVMDMSLFIVYSLCYSKYHSICDLQVAG